MREGSGIMISTQKSALRNIASVVKALSGERYLGVVYSFVAGVLGRASLSSGSGPVDTLLVGGVCALACAWISSWVFPEQ